MEIHGVLVLLAPGKILVDPEQFDNYFHYIIKGKLSLSLVSEDGRELALNWLGPHCFVGAASLLGKANENITIRVETQSMAYRLNRKLFFRLMETEPVFSLMIASHLAEIYFNAMEQLESLAFKSCKERLYSYLMEQTMEMNADGWHPLHRIFTQQELAHLIGANRVTISRMISQLCSEGWIRLINRKIEVRGVLRGTPRCK